MLLDTNSFLEDTELMKFCNCIIGKYPELHAIIAGNRSKRREDIVGDFLLKGASREEGTDLSQYTSDYFEFLGLKYPKESGVVGIQKNLSTDIDRIL